MITALKLQNRWHELLKFLHREAKNNNNVTLVPPYQLGSPNVTYIINRGDGSKNTK